MSYQAIPPSEEKVLIHHDSNLSNHDYHHHTNDNFKFLHIDSDEKGLTGPSLPATIYTSAIVCSLGFTKEEVGRLSSLLVIMPNWILVFLNYIFCFVTISALKGISEESPYCVAEFPLLIVSVAAFSTFCIGEIYETFWMAYWLSVQPTVAEHEVLTFDSDEDDRQIVSGMTAPYKMICYLLLILPKLVIGILTMYYGNTFLLVADSNQDVILEAMALAFITDNDENIFESLVPLNLREVSESMPPMKITPEQKKFGMYRPYILGFCVILTVIFCYHNACM